MSRPLRLIVRADDAGSARAANEAILETVRHGLVRNVSVMAAGPELGHAAELLRGLPGVALGLHATLNAEWTPGPRWRPVLPAARVPSLVEPDGAFTALPIVLHQRGFSLAELEAELYAQLLRLREHGLRPVYLDTHMGFEWLAGVADLLAAFAAANGLVLDRAATHPRLGAGPAAIAAHLDDPRPGPLVIVSHPGRLGPEMEAFANADLPPGRIAAERDAERQALCAAPLRALVERGLVQLETYAPPAR